ncbi:ABC1 kinase family protein [Phaeovulum vinaykumarii]|uniref:Predicted unusual protein kinase regulating ubiquinone biosynthesis, AarF/ABC1/UbiB family n=1 Tax=Phaeovulum vinaykumarii TaxID=407234 RepID=A0A1N7L094_9RHOB|nr:AarF/ABC1/UbiB kinase family protein [Phaeovulum vinaykumarii]SIS67217.1 Predicted unusual protein kinase regulating ubiquinone biosynthesis, AarF/ABC1/UbiB family [Phaeovulum vinaykumarii]SOC00800.1 predicted unusual protein kinase regulating ubiquinone biosynthesis (AarF/ABC1/UbiB family) [Phaeovulum vinaykumarii]
MTHRKFEARGLAVPSGRISRLARFGTMATGIAGGMLVDGARHLARGEKPRASDLLLTPANAMRVTRQLAHLRGAAMKIGQLMSMDAGEMLPPELSEILGHLRAEAHYMPEKQLRAVLTLQWGKNWMERFESFPFTPIAAASIGQVHRARTRDGRDLAIKIQYPGVRHSIDSDVNNVASLLKMSGIMPKDIDVVPMLAEAKRQLHEEADYTREGQCLARFGALLEGETAFVVPRLHEDLSTASVLAMDHVSGVPIESLVSADQEVRDRVMRLLIELLFRELFEFRMMQTDPNFANYLYDTTSQRVVLLDFGATREFPEEMTEQFRRLMRAGLDGDRAAVRAACLDIGFFTETTPERYQNGVLDMFALSMEPIRNGGVYDFSNSDVAMEMRDMGMALGAEREFFHIPPMDTLFLQRKFGGVYMLASRLKARVDVRAAMEAHL